LKLRNKLTNSKLIMVENAGHSAFETGIKNALIKSISEIL